jgi:uncharacterized protein
LLRPWTAFKRLAAALLLAGAVWCGHAQAADAPKFPAPVGFVNDVAQALTPAEVAAINDIATGLQDATGAQMAFLIMPDIGPYDDFTYGMAVFNQWQLGEKGKDNGLLILLALKEHRLRIITGYGLEAILPDGKLGRFRDEYLVPYLKQNRLGEGLANLGLRLAQEIATAEGKTLNGAAAKTPHRRRGESPWTNLVVLVIFLALAIASSLANRKRGMRGGFFYGGGVNYRGGGGGFGGGFGGFGGGMSGGGGVGGSW